jgi:hypothetical protein
LIGSRGRSGIRQLLPCDLGLGCPDRRQHGAVEGNGGGSRRVGGDPESEAFRTLPFRRRALKPISVSILANVCATG